MAVVPINSKDQFEALIRSPRLSVIHFYAEWANQCDTMAKVLETEALNYKEASFFQLPAEDLPEVSLQYDISAVPTFLLFSSGQLVDRVNGADTPQLTLKIREQLAKEPSSNGPTCAVPSNDSNADDADLRLRRKIDALINVAPVMLFMKGVKNEPRCGFSKQIVAILDELEAEYLTFDILSNEDVRQGLKRFSNWPTYPQLYVRGELVGGLDIVREMHEAGELAPMLPKKQNLQDRLQQLVKEDHCMVFMKGNRSTPKCGFSRQLMEILKETGITFKTFDILEDEEVRQGLKSFSNWPTYPQVYVKGELIGGLDIIKELKDSGELLASLQGQS